MTYLNTLNSELSIKYFLNKFILNSDLSHVSNNIKNIIESERIHTQTINLSINNETVGCVNHVGLYLGPGLDPFFIELNQGEEKEKLLKDSKTKIVLDAFSYIKFDPSIDKSTATIGPHKYKVVEPLKNTIECYLKDIEKDIYNKETASPLLRRPVGEKIISGILGTKELFLINYSRVNVFGNRMAHDENILITPFGNKKIYPSKFHDGEDIFGILKKILDIDIDAYEIGLKRNYASVLEKVSESMFDFS